MSEKDESRGGLSREEYRRALYLEIVRKAVLAEMEKGRPRDADGNPRFRSEDEAVLWSLWKLLNPFGVKDRTKAETSFAQEAEPPEDDLPPRPPMIRTVTAHTHPGEPLEASPDDLLMYSRLDRERGSGIHILADGFDYRILR